MAKRELVYSGFNRFWHWTQAALILLLMATGFEIHGSFQFFGFGEAVRIHNVCSVAFLVLIAFAIFWHLTTGEWRQYVPSFENVVAQARYYVVGIFKNDPHPTQKTRLSKLNPLQKIVYAGLKVLVIPLMVTSGLLYMFYRFPHGRSVPSLNLGSLQGIAVLHTAGAFLLLVFLIGHLYLMTTGRTVTSNLKAMITGYEELDGHDSPEAREGQGQSEPQGDPA